MTAERPANVDEREQVWRNWMVSAQAGDRAAYEKLLHACVPLIKSEARRRGVPPDGLDDVVQDTLLTLHQARHTYDPARPLLAWLRTLAQRRAIDFLRRHGRNAQRELHAPHAYESFPDAKPDPSSAAVRSDRAAALLRAVTALPARQREAIEHLLLRERSLAEAAAATGRKTGALKVNLHRALKSLRIGLSQNDGSTHER